MFVRGEENGMFLGYVGVNTALAFLPMVIFMKVNNLARYDTFVIDLRAYVLACPTYLSIMCP